MRLAALFFLVVSPLLSQVVEATNCVYREGDNPQYSQPHYDDSHWDQAPPDLVYQRPKSNILWQRCRMILPQATAPLYFQVRSNHAWKAYVNGILAGTFGNPETGNTTRDFMQERPIPAGLRPNSVVLAIRFTNTNVLWDTSRYKPVVGTLRDLQLRRLQTIYSSVRDNRLSMVMAPFILATAILFLFISRAESGRRAAFWFGIVAGTFALMRINNAMIYLQLPSPALLNGCVQWIGNMVYYPFAPFLFYAVANKKVPTAIRALSALNLIIRFIAFFPFSVAILGPAQHSTPGRLVLASITILCCGSALHAFLPIHKLRGWDIALFLSSACWILMQCLTMISDGSLGVRRAIQFQTAAVIPAILVFSFVLASRLRLVRVERDDLSLDMQAARDVQRRLVPEDLPSIPGFSLEAAYLPPKEVGGDFYQFLPAEDGSLLVVVGDVSGKGLDAAMLVSAVVGGLGTLLTREPGVVLSALNNALIGKTRGGFVTCVCALFQANGSVDLANAGHIPPYVEGREVDLDPGPPLGLIKDADYPTVHIPQASRTFTFLSDGVLEATNKNGEMLGFDRLPALTAKPAREIAAEAERWGQDDDITIVKVTFAPRAA